MLGFTLPLLAFGALEGLVATLLLAPSPINKPAIELMKLTRTRQGQSVMYTIATVLLFLLLSPAWDLFSLYRTSNNPATSDSSLTNLERRESEASANLSGIMTASELFLMFLVQKLGLTLARLEDLEGSVPGSYKASDPAVEAGDVSAAPQLNEDMVQAAGNGFQGVKKME